MDKDFPVGAIVECIADNPSEYGDVVKGAKGIVTMVEGDEIHATWVNPDGGSNEGYLYRKNVRRWTAPKAPHNDFRAFITAFASLLEQRGHRKPSSTPEKLLELGRSWQGTTQLLYEMIAWLDQSPDAAQVLGLIGTTWVVPAPKEEANA